MQAKVSKVWIRRLLVKDGFSRRGCKDIKYTEAENGKAKYKFIN